MGQHLGGWGMVSERGTNSTPINHVDGILPVVTSTLPRQIRDKKKSSTAQDRVGDHTIKAFAGTVTSGHARNQARKRSSGGGKVSINCTSP